MSRAKKPTTEKVDKTKAPQLEFTVRPSETRSIYASKVYLSLETLRALGIDAGSFIQISSNPRTLGIATPATLDPDVIKISLELRRVANLCLGDKIRLTKVQRPPNAGRLLVYAGPEADKDAAKQLLLDIALLQPKMSVDGLTIVRAEENALGKDVSKDMAALSLSDGAPRLDQGPLMMTAVTDIEFTDEVPSRSALVTYADIGGLQKELKELRSKIELPLNKPELFERFRTAPERGFLLYGPPGTGKTLLLKAIANETSAHIIRVNAPALFSKYQGETESSLRDIFEEANRFAPSIIFIDEIDALAPKRDSDDSGESESRVVATLLTLMDGMSAGSRVVVIGATNRPNSLDPALRRPGRFGQELEIGIPDADGRKDILSLRLSDMPHKLTNSEITDIADKTHGYVGADLEALSREAVMAAIEDALGRGLSNEEMFVEKSHFDIAFASVRPSAMREIFLETPKTYWSDIGGQEKTIQRLKEAVEWPLKYEDSFDRLGLTPPRGVLLYGPPGCSKTLLVKALATEAGLNFLAVKGPEIFNKYVGESERAIREVFRKARATAPSIIFFDEIDALTVSRGDESGAGGDRVLTSILNEMDGIEALKGVVVVAATNRPDIIDSALMRPGRLDHLLYVAPPDLASRRQIFLIQLSKMAVDDSVDIDLLAERTAGCSGAEIVSICQQAGFLAMNEDVNIRAIRQDHIEAVLSKLRRNITPQMIEYFEDFARTGASVNFDTPATPALTP